jgi:hypothetical protein
MGQPIGPAACATAHPGRSPWPLALAASIGIDQGRVEAGAPQALRWERFRSSQSGHGPVLALGRLVRLPGPPACQSPGARGIDRYSIDLFDGGCLDCVWCQQVLRKLEKQF